MTGGGAVVVEAPGQVVAIATGRLVAFHTMNTSEQGPKTPRALTDMSRRELRRFGQVYADRDDMIRRANTCGVGVNEIARLTGLAKTTVIRALGTDGPR